MSPLSGKPADEGSRCFKKRASQTKKHLLALFLVLIEGLGRAHGAPTIPNSQRNSVVVTKSGMHLTLPDNGKVVGTSKQTNKAIVQINSTGLFGQITIQNPTTLKFLTMDKTGKLVMKSIKTPRATFVDAVGQGGKQWRVIKWHMDPTLHLKIHADGRVTMSRQISDDVIFTMFDNYD